VKEILKLTMKSGQEIWFDPNTDDSDKLRGLYFSEILIIERGDNMPSHTRAKRAKQARKVATVKRGAPKTTKKNTTAKRVPTKRSR